MLDNRRAEALTLNNIGFAIASGGEDAAAIQTFEAAASILAELESSQHEGQVIANLGTTHLRHGRANEAMQLLQTALEKLGTGLPCRAAGRRAAAARQLSRDVCVAATLELLRGLEDGSIVRAEHLTRPDDACRR